MLNVSRPFLINNILASGKLPFIKVGTHRRIQFGDLLAYKKRRSLERLDALAAMANIQSGGWRILTKKREVPSPLRGRDESAVPSHLLAPFEVEAIFQQVRNPTPEFGAGACEGSLT